MQIVALLGQSARQRAGVRLGGCARRGTVLFRRMHPVPVLGTANVLDEELVHGSGKLSEDANQADPECQLPQQLLAQSTGRLQARSSHEPPLLITVPRLMQLRCVNVRGTWTREAKPERRPCALRRCPGRGRVGFMAGKPQILRDDRLRQLLVDRKIRITEQRMVILRELAKLRIPTSHPELTERISGPGLDRATIYRNLLSLTGAGILVKTQLGDNVWRFELPQSGSTEHGMHPHFVCNDCGDVSCLPADSVALRGHAKRNQVAEVQLRGRCTGCARV